MREGVTHLSGWIRRAAIPSLYNDCSLVIPTYRRPDVVVGLLKALAELPDAPGEVVVVDGSPDGATEEAMATWADLLSLNFDLIYVSSPAGLTLQRNVGIDVSTREFVFYLDDDCLPKPNYFHRIRQAFYDDREGKVGGVRGFFTNSLEAALPPIWKLRLALGLVKAGPPGKYYPTGTSTSWNGVKPFSGYRPVDVLAGGAAAYRRQVFARHRFSKFFYGYSQGEDLEMSRRIATEWQLLVCGDALVDHNHAEGGRPLGISRGRMVVRNRHFIWKRHTPGIKIVHRLQFWLDHGLIIAFSLASFLHSPRTASPWLYSLGILLGGLECLVNPPRYQESAATREYELARQRPGFRSQMTSELGLAGRPVRQTLAT